MLPSFAVNMTVFTLAVVTLAVGPLHYAGRPDPVGGVAVAVTMAVPVCQQGGQEDGEKEGEGEYWLVHLVPCEWWWREGGRDLY